MMEPHNVAEEAAIFYTEVLPSKLVDLMVEELLETFVSVVNTQLFKCVEVENFKTGNIQHSAKKTFR